VAGSSVDSEASQPASTHPSIDQWHLLRLAEIDDLAVQLVLG
jgi:hypothetical protein